MRNTNPFVFAAEIPAMMMATACIGGALAYRFWADALLNFQYQLRPPNR